MTSAAPLPPPELDPGPLAPDGRWAFGELLRLPQAAERWEKVRRWFFLRESTYDMTSRCNMSCDGCYYFEGEKQYAADTPDPEAWRRLLRAERERGITYVVLAGAEPSLVPDLLAACHEEIPLGTIATNGLKRIPEAIGYRLHISVWGNDETSQRVRAASRLLPRQLDSYAGDPRALFVYTFSPHNVAESVEVVEHLARRGCQVTFNMFSAPVGYRGSLRHDAVSRRKVRETMLLLLREFPETVIYSPYSAVVHTEPRGLHDLFGCSYPRRNPAHQLGLGRTFRQYRADLTWDRSAACCVPDTDCADCRHYAAGSAVVTARLNRHATRPEAFLAWLDYVDTYLAVWLCDYRRGETLCAEAALVPELLAHHLRGDLDDHR